MLLVNARASAERAGWPLGTVEALERVIEECPGWGARYAEVSRGEIPAGHLVASRLGHLKPSEMQQQHASDVDTLIELIRVADEERSAHWRAVGRSLKGVSGPAV